MGGWMMDEWMDDRWVGGWIDGQWMDKVFSLKSCVMSSGSITYWLCNPPHIIELSDASAFSDK